MEKCLSALPCWACKSEKIVFKQSLCEPSYGFWYLICRDCYEHTGNHATKSEALVEWNQIMTRMAS